MNEVIRSRMLVLVGLAVIGVGLAGIGTTLGMTGPLSSTGTPAEFVVSDDNITFTSDDIQETVVDDLSNVSKITVEETDSGQYTIQTKEDQPLDEKERKRARTIAMTNETVNEALEEMDRYELSVEPVQKLNLSASSVQSYDTVIGVNETKDTTASSNMTIVNTTDDHSDESVIIGRSPSYVEDRAVVRIRHPGEDSPHDLKYTVDIDLADRTVTDITDWNDV
ncbi:hypothetical protein [Halostagnicola kamekurae]|uniref:Uncharacterized protein n=1 Tax=Halostagnicola kamekurae TaxID=619731 RepID=A0A1I6QP18_9EURY|nr:hypothetical protein [Halostagnicola kamekurae]SFS54206.1 hypothetical protein SAMN04488556_1416 [Halostagnicola kamekurae]